MNDTQGAGANPMPAPPQPENARIRRPGQKMKRAEREQVQQRFLDAYALTGILTSACQSAGVHHSTVQDWLKNDAFKARYDEAHAQANDRLRQEVMRRAVLGVKKPVYQQGKQVGEITEYSDLLLMFLVKSRMPEFRDKVELSGHVQHGHVNLSDFTAEERAKLFELAASEAQKEASR